MPYKENSLAVKNPELAKQWHPTKNGDKTPFDFTVGSNERVWWLCEKNSEHIWKTSIHSRAKKTRPTNCPYCSNRKVNLTGQKFGKLTVTRKTDKRTQNGKVIWECLCDCGNIHNTSTDSLKQGKAKSCGCILSPNLIGQKFGKLTVVQKTDNKTSNGCVIWECQCDCGNICERSTRSLKPDKNCSCGCLTSFDLIGQRFNKLVVVKKAGKTPHGSVLWECKCDCGNICEQTTGHLRNGTSQSCGCLRRPNLKGQKFGKLTVIEKTNGRDSNGNVIWECICDCSKHTVCFFTTRGLMKGWNKSCGLCNSVLDYDVEEIDAFSADILGNFLEKGGNPITSDRHERNPEAREACIEHYKEKYKWEAVQCFICDFKFDKYGVDFKDKIHVHHKIMISGQEGEYKIDPRIHLVPVCPNCHMVIHSKKEGFTVEEVKSMISKK